MRSANARFRRLWRRIRLCRIRDGELCSFSRFVSRIEHVSDSSICPGRSLIPSDCHGVRITPISSRTKGLNFDSTDQNAATGNSTTIPGYTVGSGPARNLSLSSSSSLVRPSTTTTIPSSTQQIIAITPTTTASAPPSVTPIAIALPVVKSLGERLSISVEIPLAVLAVVGGMILWV